MLSFEKRWATHLLAGFAPANGSGLAPRRGEVDYAAVLMRMMREATPIAALGLRAAIWLCALAPLWLWGKLSTVSKLAVERHPDLLRELLSHRLFVVRELTMLLKLCAAMALLGAPSVRQRSGYDHVQAAAKVESGLHVRLPMLDRAGALRVRAVDDAAAAEIELQQEAP
jgi:hypothetical protein